MRLRSGAAMAVVYRLAAVVLIHLLAWDLPYATHAALEKKERERGKKEKEIPKNRICPDKMLSA